jgi:hypothetical protein
MLHFVQHDGNGQSGTTPGGRPHFPCQLRPRPIVILNEVKDLPAACPERCFTPFSMTAMDRRSRSLRVCLPEIWHAECDRGCPPSQRKKLKRIPLATSVDESLTTATCFVSFLVAAEKAEKCGEVGSLWAPPAAFRCVFATIGLYTRLMIHSQTALTGAPAVHTAFILRTSWDSSAQQWCILVKPVAGDDARLFGDMEAAFLYVEMLMAGQVERLGIQITGARCTSGGKLQETDR